MLLMILSFNDHEKSNAHTKASARPKVRKSLSFQGRSE